MKHSHALAAVLELVVLAAWIVLLIVARIWADGQPPEALETPPVACMMIDGVLVINPAGETICETASN